MLKDMVDKSSIVGQASAESSTLSFWGITELLENDPRPSFVLDLEDSQGRDSQRLQIVFSNSPLQRHSRVSRLIHGRVGSPAEAHEAEECARFKEWTSGTATSTFVYGALRWSCSTLRERWRIVNGNTMSHNALGTLTASGEAHIAASTPSIKTKSTSEQRPSKSEKRLNRYSHTASTWAEALPQNAHVKFVKDTHWSATPLGPLGGWSSLLRQMTQFLLADSRPACLCW